MNRLTVSKGAAMLAPLSSSLMTAGIEAPRTGRYTRPLSSVVFLCPPKTQTGLFRLLFIMAGCIEQPLKRLAGACTGSFNLIHSATQQLKLVAGGKSIFYRTIRMNTPQNHSAQISEQTTINTSDLTLAFAKLCFDYGAIIEGGATDRSISNRLNWLISDAQKLSLAAQNLYSEIAGGDL